METNTQTAGKRAEPDVACSAGLGRGGARVDSLLLGFLADWVSGFGLRIEEWSEGELPYRIYEGHQGAPDTLYIAEGENLRDALLDAAILSGTQEFVAELQGALHPPTEQTECGWRAIARTNEAAYNETLAALRDLRTTHTDMMRMWMEESQAAVRAHPLDEWHEDIGPVLWWRFPVDEPPYCGTPGDSDWPGYHTHWTRIVVPVKPAA